MKKNIEHDNKSCEHARNKNYYENLAKFVLEEFLPKRFYDLKLSDRPDIRQADWIGIEVTKGFLAKSGVCRRNFQKNTRQGTK